jgi:hypothetical protein
MTQIPLPLGGLFGQNMAQVLFFVFNLASTGKTKALCRAFFCFHLNLSHTILLLFGFRA